jgi:pyruvate kinase
MPAMGPVSLDLARVALRQRRTKIVATLGPASATAEVLPRLIAAGVDVFRLNFSHGTHESHEATYRQIREAERRAGRMVAVLADLCGPKIRVGRFEGGAIELVDGERVTITVRPVEGRPGLIPSEYAGLAADAKPGNRILLDDGKLELRVGSVEGSELDCTVVHGGRLSDRKGMNLPGVAVSAPALTDKDRADAAFAAALGVDFVALSFVRAASDVEELRALLAGLGRDPHIIAKIEKPEGVAAIDAILDAADGIMVARGDLGVEMPAEEVPLIQRELIRLAIEKNKPVIVATQMLESMIESSRPTRAEVSDVAHGAMAGADAVMLSAESATGRFPVEAVQTMDRVLRLVEGYEWLHGQFASFVAHPRTADDEPTADQAASEAVARAVSHLSRELRACAVVVPSRTGRSARMVAAERPASPLILVSRDERVCRRGRLTWGTEPYRAEDGEVVDSPELARDLVHRLGLVDPGRFVLLVSDAGHARGRFEPTVTVLAVEDSRAAR